jgi:hypothetical protein
MGEYSISRRIKLLLVAAMLTVVMAFGSAFAALQAANAQTCEKVRGTLICEEEGKNPKFTQTTAKKGSEQSSHPEETVACTDPCPPGQFKD